MKSDFQIEFTKFIMNIPNRQSGIIPNFPIGIENAVILNEVKSLVEFTITLLY